MSRITKEIAKEVAEKLTATKHDEWRKTKDSFINKLTEFYNDRIPLDVVLFGEKYPKYIRKSKSIRLYGNGFEYQYENLKEEVIELSGNKMFEPTKEQADILIKIQYEYGRLRSEYYDLKSEIETMLYSLRTYNRVLEQFSEAYPFLPNKITTALTVNIEDIRKKL